MKHARFQSIPTAFLVLFGVLLAGCEAAQVPLGPPDELAVDARVTGHWVSVSDEEEADTAVLKVWAFNDHEYYVEWEIEDDEDELARIRTYASDLGDFLFANTQCINCTEDDRKEWYFYQFEVTPDDELIIRSIRNVHYSEAMADMTRSSDVRAYVQQHMHDEGFFSEEVGRFVRVESSDDDFRPDSSKPSKQSGPAIEDRRPARISDQTRKNQSRIRYVSLATPTVLFIR